MESIARLINFKNILMLIISFSFLKFYDTKVNGETTKNIDEIDFETSLNQNSVLFHEYENPENLFDDFFGLGDSLNKSSLNTNFQDLSLQIDSKNVRQLYKEKLLEMTKKKKNEKDKLNWSFFNKKI